MGHCTMESFISVGGLFFTLYFIAIIRNPQQPTSQQLFVLTIGNQAGMEVPIS